MAVGSQALSGVSTGNGRNTALGHLAAPTLTTGDSNVVIGYYAGGQLTTGDANVFIGGGEHGVTNPAGFATTTGNANTYIGHSAGTLMTTGSDNTIIGGFTGNEGGLDIRTSSNHIVLSDGDGNPRLVIDNVGNLRYGTASAFNNEKYALGFEGASRNGITLRNTNASGTPYMMAFQWGSSTVGDITSTSTTTTYNTTSDYRLKENVVAMTGATARLKQLAPKRFNFIVDADTTVDGFLAHEVQSVVPEAVRGTHNEVDDDGNPVYQGIDQSKLVPLLVATIQELEARIAALESN